MGQTLFAKVWQQHQIASDPGGDQIFIGLHLIHEVTSPQAFAMLKERGLKVLCPERTFATVDHIIPTDSATRPLADPLAEEMLEALQVNCRDHGVPLFHRGSGKQGIVHVVGPEQGLTQPGMTIVCGDSHTATHGAFGAVAFGIGTSQVRDVLASQTLRMEPLKVRRIMVTGELKPGVTAKDLILHIIRSLGAKGGSGYAYEYAGPAIEALSMEERMTLCNMSIEGGARCGYVNPDATTFAYLKGKAYAPKDAAFDAAVERWKAFASDHDAVYDDEVHFDAADVNPTVTFGVSPDQAIGIHECLPDEDEVAKAGLQDALEYMGFSPGQAIKGTPVEVAFIGSCTNGRYSDFAEIAPLLKGKKVAAGLRALAVPGSQLVDRQAREAGIAEIFEQAGFEWRQPGCSMCLAMNPDRLIGDQVCASSSNRNFKGRQGSATGRTLLMSPLMVAAAAVTGQVADPREVFSV